METIYKHVEAYERNCKTYENCETLENRCENYLKTYENLKTVDLFKEPPPPSFFYKN